MRLKMRERPAGRSPVMYQKWLDLLFLHWEFSPGAVQSTLPPGLYVDTFKDKAYLGVVPFFMRDVRPRFVPSVPGVSNFQEINRGIANAPHADFAVGVLTPPLTRGNDVPSGLP
jgi:uncharacterized protein YqjF (DUF2071 family)